MTFANSDRPEATAFDRIKRRQVGAGRIFDEILVIVDFIYEFFIRKNDIVSVDDVFKENVADTTALVDGYTYLIRRTNRFQLRSAFEATIFRIFTFIVGK